MNLTALVTLNRQRLAAALLPGSVAVCQAADAAPLAPDGSIRPQPNSDLYWLTGLALPGISLLLMPQHPDEKLREVLFIRPAPEQPDPSYGPGLSAAEAAQRTGIASVRWQHELEAVLAEAAPLARHIYLTTDEGPHADTRPGSHHSQFGQWCRQKFPLHDYQRLAPLLLSLRTAKTEAEASLMRRAASIAEAGFGRVLSFVRPGVTARQTEAELLHEYLLHDGSSWEARPSVVATGAFTCEPWHRAGSHDFCQSGELLVLDTAVAYYRYHTHLTRTLPVSGHFTPRQRQVYDAVLRVHRGVQAFAHAGLTHQAIQQRYQELMTDELLRLELFTAAELKQRGAAYFLQQYGHPSFGHLVGLDVPDAGSLYEPLPEGTVISNGPGIYIREENLGIRIQSNLLLRADEAEDLTAAIPVEAADIEQLMQQPRPSAEYGPPAAVAANALSLKSLTSAEGFWAAVRQYGHLLLIPLLLLDAAYSYVQHINVPHDGDMTAIILPRVWLQHVLEDPFGLSALLRGEVYAGPNRYFAHQALLTYLRNVPLALQAFTDPIQSVYMACAIAKIIVQLALIYLLALYISKQHALTSRTFLLAAIIVTPFFQTAGYTSQMGIIDRSVTYVFFYALPAALLMLYFYPFYRYIFTNNPQPISPLWHAVLPVLAVVLALNGPLVPAVAAIMCGSTLLYLAWKTYRGSEAVPFSDKARTLIARMPRGVVYQLLFFVLCCAYSLYLGTFNVENVGTVTLAERYDKLFTGIPIVLGESLGLPLLLGIIVLNILLIKFNYQDKKARRILLAALWLSVLSLIYILLLPLGGYRDYRPHIIRRDSLIPVSLSMLFLLGISTIYLIDHASRQYRKLYLAGVVGMVLLYSYVDRSDLRENNCEVDALRAIASSPRKTVHLEQNCSVMEWGVVTDSLRSQEQGKMLKHWRITSEEKLYYH